MAKKLILLILIIPIIMMICLFAATKTISNLVDVSVRGVEIIDTSNHVYLNLDKGETYTLEYAVYPTNAKNTDVLTSTEAIEGKHLAGLGFSQLEDGRILVTPDSAGSAKVCLTTADGGFKDTIIVHVEATALKAIEATASKSELYVGETASISTVFSPSNPSNAVLEYESSNPSVVSVNDSGTITAVRKGTATITVTSDYNKDIKDTVTITVSNKDTMDLERSELVSWSVDGSISISIDSDDFDISHLSYEISDEDGNALPESLFTANFVDNGGVYSLDYAFIDESFVGSVIVKITYTNGTQVITKECTVSRVREISVSFDAEAYEAYADQTVNVSFTLTPADAFVTYSLSLSNDNITARTSGTRIIINTMKAGVTELTLRMDYVDEENPELSQTKEEKINIIVKPRSISVIESANTYGIENILAVGGSEYDYSSGVPTLVETENTQNQFFIKSTFSGTIGSGFTENFTWVTDSDEVYVTTGKRVIGDTEYIVGNIAFANDTFVGTVNVYGLFSYGGFEQRSETFSIKCVSDGVNVYSYKDLYYATSAKLPVVLHSDIKDDFGYIDGDVKYTEIHTTYDDTYYKNTGSYDAATVKILIEFRNDVYGNGHIINAHNIAYGLDSSGALKSDALFKGPLNFVALIENGSSVTVKGQDNICFALYEGVTVSNVELRGCDLTADKDGSVDLVDLTYSGTTVEVLGDNVSIEYSRINNGRTVIRAFGDISDSAKIINVSVKNSVLSGAREFIMKIGSNCYYCVDGNPSPMLDGDSGNDYSAKETYSSKSAAEQAAHDERFIKTFVTVKNSVFEDAGLFAIGMDSHFSGTALADGPSFVSTLPGSLGNIFKTANGTLIDDWKNLAKTSYGAKLTFEENVKLYCWKDLENVDSSTLIEVPSGSKFSGKIDFNVKEMIGNLAKKSDYKSIVCTDNGITYVHAGIAFFGGGKNYSVFYSPSDYNYDFARYKISLMDVGRDYFRYAAGNESFYFYMYDSESSFKYSDQKAALAGDGYSCIYKK